MAAVASTGRLQEARPRTIPKPPRALGFSRLALAIPAVAGRCAALGWKRTARSSRTSLTPHWGRRRARAARPAVRPRAAGWHQARAASARSPAPATRRRAPAVLAGAAARSTSSSASCGLRRLRHAGSVPAGLDPRPAARAGTGARGSSPYARRRTRRRSGTAPARARRSGACDAGRTLVQRLKLLARAHGPGELDAGREGGGAEQEDGDLVGARKRDVQRHDHPRLVLGRAQPSRLSLLLLRLRRRRELEEAHVTPAWRRCADPLSRHRANRRRPSLRQLPDTTTPREPDIEFANDA
jgi:hypothetical protein